MTIRLTFLRIVTRGLPELSLLRVRRSAVHLLISRQVLPSRRTQKGLHGNSEHWISWKITMTSPRIPITGRKSQDLKVRIIPADISATPVFLSVNSWIPPVVRKQKAAVPSLRFSSDTEKFSSMLPKRRIALRKTGRRLMTGTT